MTYPRVVRQSVCLSVTLVHPTKAAGRNEMPFGRDILVASSKIVLDRGPSFRTKMEDLWVGTPLHSDVAYC